MQMVFNFLCSIGVHSAPELSFAVRYLYCYAGIMITASHNPKIDNGLKFYQEDGRQINSSIANAITGYMSRIFIIYSKLSRQHIKKC